MLDQCRQWEILYPFLSHIKIIFITNKENKTANLTFFFFSLEDVFIKIKLKKDVSLKLITFVRVFWSVSNPAAISAWTGAELFFS